MKQTERDRLLKIAHTALDAAERILAPTPLQVTPPLPPLPPTLEAIDRGVRLAERAAAIFSALADDDTARLLRRAAPRAIRDAEADLEKEAAVMSDATTENGPSHRFRPDIERTSSAPCLNGCGIFARKDPGGPLLYFVGPERHGPRVEDVRWIWSSDEPPCHPKLEADR